MSNELADALKDYVSQGGTVICDGKFGEVSDDGILCRNMPGGPLNQLLGCSHVDVEADNMQIELKWNNTDSLKLDGYYEKRKLKVFGENCMIKGEFEDGSPAVMENAWGKGRIIYIPTYLWYGYFKESYGSVASFLGILDKDLGLRLHSVNNNKLKICTTRGEQGLMLFAFNYGEAHIAAEVILNNIHANSCTITNLYSGEKTSTAIYESTLLIPCTVKERDVCILKVDFEKGL